MDRFPDRFFWAIRFRFLTFFLTAETTNTFKNRLDKFWSDQKVLYNYEADLNYTGNRSNRPVL